ncbi:hypothetical protein E4U55_000107 [Claviceps digitariae]|nr:hypothetical protein E4U55_000107 [Claviceps digitariae]
MTATLKSASNSTCGLATLNGDAETCGRSGSINNGDKKSNDDTQSASQAPCRHISKESKENRGWRRIVCNFTPSWFAINMGTGIVSMTLHKLPYNSQWLQYISYVIFGLNIILFVAFLGLFTVRYIMYPKLWWFMLSHPGQSLFLGCFPMGFAMLRLIGPFSPLAAIINMMILCCKQWGNWLVYLAWVFWWIDVLLSVTTAISMPFIVMHFHKPVLSTTTAALLLPIVPAVVAAATGGVVAEALPDHERAFTTLVVSYILWGLGECLSACVLALYFHRLTVHSLPPKEVLVSVFLPIGPLGQGGFGIQQLGKVAVKLLPQTHVFKAAGVDVTRGAEALYMIGIFLGMILWGFALVWLCFALISLATIRDFPFNMSWWGFTFPLGVWANCTSMLAINLDSTFFSVAATDLQKKELRSYTLEQCNVGSQCGLMSEALAIKLSKNA